MPGFGGKGFDVKDRGICKVCQIEIAKNRFYCDEHRPAKPEPKAKEPKSRPATAVSAATAIVREGTPTTEAARKRPPTAKEWQDKMGLALALLTTWMVLRIVSRSDLHEAPDEVQDSAVDHLEMGEDEELEGTEETGEPIAVAPPPREEAAQGGKVPVKQESAFSKRHRH